MMEGWLCPRCNKVNAPWVSQCACHETITTNTTIVGDQQLTWPNDFTLNNLFHEVPTAAETLDGKIPN